MAPARNWRCTRCGLVVRGVQQTDGTVRATDRPADLDLPVADAVCRRCADADPLFSLARRSRPPVLEA